MEIDVSHVASRNATWLDWDNRLLAVLTRHLQLYEEDNPIVRTFSNPLDEEGFKMKRYGADGHHEFHADGGQERRGDPVRVIAFLFYLNDVIEGGETVFLNQAVNIAPRCGRVALFPTAFTHVHAGRPPIFPSKKYVVANFVRM